MVMYLTCKFQIATCLFTSSILDDPNQTPNPISGPERGPVDRRIWKSGRQVESQDPVPAPNAGIRLSSRGMLGILMKKERERERIKLWYPWDLVFENLSWVCFVQKRRGMKWFLLVKPLVTSRPLNRKQRLVNHISNAQGWPDQVYR